VKYVLISMMLMTTAAQSDEWEKTVKRQIDLGGKVSRACFEHTGKCTLALRAGDYMMIEVESVQGITESRIICKFNKFLDRRDCVDFDTRRRSSEIFANGRWVTAR
jgi:hypothetical protein